MTDLDPDWDIPSTPEAAARDLLVQAAHLGLVTALVFGKNASGEIAILGTEDLHDWNRIRAMLADLLNRVDAAILEEVEFAPDTLMN